MKVLGKVLKVLTALAAIAGAVYVAITYGDKIVAWVKKTLKLDCCCKDTCCDCECECDCDCECEEAPAEEVAEAAAEVCEQETVQADEADFEG